MTVSVIEQHRQQALQRIKVGLIGLAAVLLLIGLASAVFNSVNRERQVVTVGSAQPETVAEIAANVQAEDARNNEPLAELGVTPAATVATQNRSER